MTSATISPSSAAPTGLDRSVAVCAVPKLKLRHSSFLDSIAKRIQRVGEIRREGGFKNKSATIARAGEDEFSGVEHLTGDEAAGGFAEAGVWLAAIEEVAGDGMSEMLEVDPDLMGATGVQFDFHMGRAAQAFEDAVRGAGVAAFSHGHALALEAVARNRGVNFAAQSAKLAADDGFVDFLSLARGKLGGEMEVRGVVLGDDEAAAGFLVKTMDNAGPGDAADAAEPPRAMMEQSVDESVRGVARGGMHDQSRRLVQGQQVVIFVKDFQGDVFRASLGHFGRGPDDGDDFASAGMMGGFRRAAVDADVALREQALDGAARDAGKFGA